MIKFLPFKTRCTSAYPAYYRLALAFCTLLFPPSMGLPYGCLALLGGRVGVPTFHNDDKGCLGSVCPPVVLSTLCIKKLVIHLYHLPFGPSLSAILACWF
jgi:hypothetical protein